MKDSSLILILFALLAYINGHEYLFLILLIAFSIIYFTPQHYFDNYLSRFLGKKYKKVNEENLKSRPQEPPQEPTIETIETDIEIDDNITLDEEFDEQENQEQQYEEQQYEEQQYEEQQYQNQQDTIEK